MRYTELQVTSNFSFLRGASHPEEIVEHAAKLGYKEIAITDRNTLAGIVRAYKAAKETGIRLIVGCRLDLIDGASLLAYPINKTGYANLCELLTTGNLRAEKGKCNLYVQDVFKHSPHINFIIAPPEKLNKQFQFERSFEEQLQNYKKGLEENVYLAVSRFYHTDDSKRIYRLHQLSGKYNIPLIVTNDVHYHTTGRRQLQDIVTCVREKCTIDTAGFKLQRNAERFLKPPAEMQRLFRQYPQAIENTQQIVDQCRFSLDELKYEYPDDGLTLPGLTAQETLEKLAWEGSHNRFGEIIPEKISDQIKEELAFIKRRNFPMYFLVVHDLVREANRLKILCQGRGSAANSTVCYCLGITSVNPEKFKLLFERFASDARDDAPDIDVDFEHERREEIIQYIYKKYGRDRAAIVATVTQLHQKGAIRDVAKAMGLSLDMINRLSGSIWDFGNEWFDDNKLLQNGFNPKDKRLKKTLELTAQFMGFPRQLGQHTGGFIITKGKLTDFCPVLNARMIDRTNIEWNKDDIDTLGAMKVDVLALGMLTCIRKAFDLAAKHYDLHLTLANVPQDDPAVYEMMCKGDTIGVFQIESRAQMSMLPRLKPRCFYDVVIEVAIVRPGPIQGNMVHPYLRRRNGEEPVTYPSKEFEEILGRTLGVPLFQEQAMEIAIAAGFTPAEADKLRSSMSTFKINTGLVTQFQERLVAGLVARGYDKEFAIRVFKQLEGFGSYGFPESHAASFAHLVYISAWIKCFYPDIFACALLNSMPMGFYQPAQIIIDARKHGVEVRPIDINYSYWDNTLEDLAGKYRALRLGFRQIKGIREEDINLLITKRGERYRSIEEVRNTGISRATLEKLADADAFRSVGTDRRMALWDIYIKDLNIGIYKGQQIQEKEIVTLPEMALAEHVIQDYAFTGLSIKAHPVSFVREKLTQLNIVTTAALANMQQDQPVKVAGLVLVRQCPQTAKGVCFMTIEDETGNANIVIFPNLFKQYRATILQSQLIMIEGKIQREGEIIHVITERCYNLTSIIKSLIKGQQEKLQLLTLSRADEKTPLPQFPDQNNDTKTGNIVQGKLFPEGRNFK